MFTISGPTSECLREQTPNPPMAVGWQGRVSYEDTELRTDVPICNIYATSLQTLSFPGVNIK